MRRGGKSSRRGCGGVIFRSSQIAGSAASAVKTSGAAKVMGNPSIGVLSEHPPNGACKERARAAAYSRQL
jgi:hypothetical protein